jgi:ribosomal protein S18 acetylase RimI-like enzyme
MSSTLAPPHGVCLKDFTLMTRKDRSTAATKVSKLERKIFPASESFDYNVELKKKNIGLILAYGNEDPDHLVGYLVYQRIKRVVWLHKLCVIEPERKKGIGRYLIHTLQSQMHTGGCESILLWVDEHRNPARKLYDSYGFQQIEHRLDYYAPGRAALKMELSIQK